jgi:RNase P/RNase MRP subunit p29
LKLKLLNLRKYNSLKTNQGDFMEDVMVTKDGKIIANKDIKKGETIKIDLKNLSIAREIEKGKLKPDEEGEMAIVTLPEWLATNKGLSSEIVGIIKKETKKAVLIKLEQDEVWLPKSAIEIEI